MSKPAISLALTGASGMPYALRLLEQLLQTEHTVYLMVSSPARIVLEQESGLRLPSRPAEIKEQLLQRYPTAAEQFHVFGKEDWFAPVASGTGVPDAMVICPCTMGTLGCIAAGTSRNLIERAADVIIKEQKKLILLPREMPLSTIHLENMLRLAQAGVTIMPPNPGFYQQPDSIADLVDFVVARVLDQLGIPHQLLPKWGQD